MTEIKDGELIEYHCPTCRKLLTKAIFHGIVEVKCGKCKKIVRFKH